MGHYVIECTAKMILIKEENSEIEKENWTATALVVK